jgi:hypothetical protein
VAAAGRFARGLHTGGLSTQQRLHLAALLIALAALPLYAGDFHFDTTTQQDFRIFSRVIGQGIFATPVQPARAGGIVTFDAGVAATAVSVDTKSSYWQHIVSADVTTSGYIALPRIVVAKGFGVATLSGTYAKINNTGAKVYGGALDIPIIRGTLATPELALRGSYATLTGVDLFKEKTYGLEAFLSKGFGPLTPYIAVGRQRTNATGTATLAPVLGVAPTFTLHDTSDFNRITVGVRLSLFLPKIVIEATQGQVRSYAAKVSIGL